MKGFVAHLPHLLMALIIVGAAVALAVVHVIPGSTAVALIGTVGGASVGGVLGSGSASAVTVPQTGAAPLTSPSTTTPPS